MNRTSVALLIFAKLFLTVFLFAGHVPSNAAPNAASPVVVELFTSEGCSSCPPADALLQRFDKQPYPGAHLIVLSEHVDYWNHIGWTDPYSDAAFSQRQSSYGTELKLESVYTPQIVVDGAEEFAANNSEDAQRVFGKAAAEEKVPVKLSSLSVVSNHLRAHIETGELSAKFAATDVVLAVALDHAESQVKGGENSGRRLTHVAVVRNLSKVGSMKSGQTFSRDVEIKLKPGTDSATLRVIAFLQQPGPGKIVGAAEETLGK
jgi:hypothetical protein